MVKTRFVPEGTPVPIRYGVRGGGWLVLSGHMGQQNLTLVEGGFKEEFEQTLINIKDTLESHGAAFTNVIKANVYLSNMDDFMVMNDNWTCWFRDPFPARTCVAGALPFGALVEMDVWAYIDHD